MLSNCRAETDLHNQTIGGKMGHVGKQLFWSLLACFGTICPHVPHLFVFRSNFLIAWTSCRRSQVGTISSACFLEMTVMCTCFLRAEPMLLFCYRCSGYRYKSIEHSTSSTSINTFTCSPDALSLSLHRDLYKL